MLIHVSDVHPPSVRLVGRENALGSSITRQLPPLKSDVARPSDLLSVASGAGDLSEQLFNNRASVKILISRISMHLESSMRSDLFKQIDELLDLEAWDDESALIRVDSFQTLLRLLTSKARIKRPALSVSNKGNVMASWLAESRRLTVEFEPRDNIRMVASRLLDSGERESLAYGGPLRQFDQVLASLNAVGWYREET